MILCNLLFYLVLVLPALLISRDQDSPRSNNSSSTSDTSSHSTWYPAGLSCLPKTSGGLQLNRSSALYCKSTILFNKYLSSFLLRSLLLGPNYTPSKHNNQPYIHLSFMSNSYASSLWHNYMQIKYFKKHLILWKVHCLKADIWTVSLALGKSTSWRHLLLTECFFFVSAPVKGYLLKKKKKDVWLDEGFVYFCRRDLRAMLFIWNHFSLQHR